MHVNAVVRVQQIIGVDSYAYFTPTRKTPFRGVGDKRDTLSRLSFAKQKDKKMETQIAFLTKDQINNRVRNGGNSFTKDEMLAHRDEIKIARQEKKEWLGGLNEAEQLDIVRAAIRNGFQLQDTKMSHLKRSDKFTPVFIRKDEATALDNEEQKLLAKLEKIAVRKAELNAVAA